MSVPRANSTTTSQAQASIWLMPSADDSLFLQAIVDDLARRFDTPVFAPHLTLAGDLNEAPENYIDTLEQLAGSCSLVAQPIEDIILTDAYFRSFYAAFECTADLDALKQVCIGALGGSLSDFTPHVSLLYGQVAEPGKSEAAAELRRAIKGRAVTFDRVAVTNSSDTTPIYEWRVHGMRALRRF